MMDCIDFHIKQAIIDVVCPIHDKNRRKLFLIYERSMILLRIFHSFCNSVHYSFADPIASCNTFYLCSINLFDEIANFQRTPHKSNGKGRLVKNFVT